MLAVYEPIDDVVVDGSVCTFEHTADDFLEFAVFYLQAHRKILVPPGVLITTPGVVITTPGGTYNYPSRKGY